MDSLTREHRSWNMSQIRGRDTKPEVQLRSLLHKAGLRFRLHDSSLAGCPDIVMRKHRTVIMAHGCFWHRHAGCRNATLPSTRTDFWQSKFRATVERDQRNEAALVDAGWRVITVWECNLKQTPDSIVLDIKSQLQGARQDGT